MKTKTYAEYKKEHLSNSSSTPYTSTATMNKPTTKYTASRQKQKLIPPGSLGTLTKANYELLKQQPQRRMGPTTSALVRPSPLFSRPPPGAALRVMPPKKRVKLDEDDDIDIKKTDDIIKPKNTDILKPKKPGEIIKPTKFLLDSPYGKGKGAKLKEGNGRETQRKHLRVPTNHAKLPQSNVMGVPDSTKSTNTLNKSKKSLTKPGRPGRPPMSSKSLSQRPSLPDKSPLLQQSLPQKSSLSPRSSLSQKSPLSPRSSLPQKSPLSQRSSLPQKSPLSQRSSLPEKSPLSQRSSLPQKSPVSQRSSLPQRPSLSERSPLPSKSLSQRSPLPQRTSSLSQRSSLSQKSSNRNGIPLKRSLPLSQKRQSNIIAQERIYQENQLHAKQPTFLGVKFKKMKKANLADQIKRSKEGKLDLMTPDSILTSVHIKDLLNESTFKTLPPAYQYQLLMLLPECDRVIGSDRALRLSQHALNNEFFTRSCQEYKDKLMDGEFNSDIILRAKNEVMANVCLDPWKAKFFEPSYGVSSLSTPTVEDCPQKLEVVESSWVAFLKFSENSTDDFEEALSKMQVTVKQATQIEVKKKDERRKREDFIRSNEYPSRTLAQNRLMTFRNSGTLKSRNLMRAETVTKEKSRKALKKAQILQRKKAFDKQLKDAKAKILEEARLSSRKDTDSLSSDSLSSDTDLLKSKLISRLHNQDRESCMGLSPLANNTDNEISSPADHLSNITSGSLFACTSEPNKNENGGNAQVINLCDNMALKNLIKNSDPLVKPVSNFTPNKRGPKKRTSSRIVKGPSTFLTNSDGSCPCNVKAMVMCVQCESYWHGDSINMEQLCILCT